MKVLEKYRIENCIDRCIVKLTDCQRTINGEIGWHQHLGTRKIGIVATAMALLLYKKIGDEPKFKEESLCFIVRKQNEDGGWSYISNTHRESNVESTCWALTALQTCGEGRYTNVIDRGVRWLYGQLDNQIDDNGWGFGEKSATRTYITAFVLRTLKLLLEDGNEKFESAEHWLLESQNEDGGWGETSDKGSSTFFTCYSIIALLECGKQINDSAVVKAKRWLDKRLNTLSVEDHTLLCYLEFIEKGTNGDRVRITFFHYVLPYMIMAYIKMGALNKYVFSALELLTLRTKDGEIEHPMLENSSKRPIWALFDCVSAFLLFKDNYKQWNKQKEFILFRGKIVACSLSTAWLRNRIVKTSCVIILFTVLLHFLIFKLILPYWDMVKTWIDGLMGSTLGQFVISFAASCAFGVLLWIKGKMSKWFKIWWNALPNVN